MMFAPDYRCHSEMLDCLFWVMCFLCAWTPLRRLYVQNVDLGPHRTRDDITHTALQTSVSEMFTVLNRQHASIPAHINTEGGRPCAHLCVCSVYTKRIPKKNSRSAAGAKATISEVVVKYRVGMKLRGEVFIKDIRSFEGYGAVCVYGSQEEDDSRSGML